ncbi:M43 family zinc metalloprotease [Pontibacter russatus]|uniref:M43 family zinc metalloprotease n=1 Tax=Pontibacter russatus TaxID=2694929 RepID=UPI00137B1DB9|nr:M43 family zinc metalloprotease [Pontibacter russatus]
MSLAIASFARQPDAVASARGRTCATEAYTVVQQAQAPGLKARQQALQQEVQQALAQQGRGQALQADVVVTVPVVFHVVYNDAAENIPDAALLSQLEVLNADFRRLNADTLNTPDYFRSFAADTKIQFCLASVDPEGDLTTGITRTSTSSTFEYISDNVKYTSKGGVDAWDRDQYLNIWVCKIKGEILGYASQPGGPAATDGVVLHYEVVGAAPANTFATNYNRGRTATHEVGHWLGLGHVWGSGYTCSDSDGIDDTPNQMAENTGCNTGIKSSCDDSPFGDMYQNYMDYSDDACMNLFTRGQASYMQTVLATSRSSLLNSLACSGTLRSDFKTTSANDTLTMAGKRVKFSDASVGIRPTAWLWEFEGGVPAASAEQHPVVLYPQPGRYSVKLTITNGDQRSTAVKENLVHITVSDLVVYPNPATDFITIEQPARVTVRHVELLNQMGQVLVSEETKDRVLRLDVRHLPQGVYILRIKSSSGLERRKVSVLR